MIREQILKLFHDWFTIGMRLMFVTEALKLQDPSPDSSEFPGLKLSTSCLVNITYSIIKKTALLCHNEPKGSVYLLFLTGVLLTSM